MGILSALMWGPTLPGRAASAWLGEMTGFRLTRSVWYNIRDRAIEYLKKFRIQRLQEGADENPMGLAVVRVGHDGAPTSVIIKARDENNKSQLGAGMSNRSTDVLVMTLRVLISGMEKAIQMPCDLILMKQKRGVDILGSVLPKLELVHRLLGNKRCPRFCILYQNIDSGGGNQRLHRYLAEWCRHKGKTECVWRSITQYCGFHFNQLALTNEARTLLKESAPGLMRRVYVFALKLVHHKADFVEALEEWVGERYIQSGGSTVTPLSYSHHQVNNRRIVTDRGEALMRVLVVGNSLRTAMEKCDSIQTNLPANLSVRFWKGKDKVVAGSKEEAVTIISTIIRQIAVPCETRWVSLGRLRWVYLFHILGGKSIATTIGKGFLEEAYFEEWDKQLSDKNLLTVILMANVCDAVHIDAMEKLGLSEGETLRERLLGLMKVSFGEVVRMWDDLPLLYDSASDVQEAAASVLKVAINSGRRIVGAHLDGEIIDVIDMSSADPLVAANAKNSLVNAPSHNFSDLRTKSDRSLLSISEAMRGMYTFGTHAEESLRAVGSKKKCHGSHGRAVAGLFREVHLGPLSKHFQPATVSLLRAAVESRRRRASSSKGLGDYQKLVKQRIEEEFLEKLTSNPKLAEDEYSYARKIMSKEIFRSAAKAWTSEKRHAPLEFDPDERKAKRRKEDRAKRLRKEFAEHNDEKDERVGMGHSNVSAARVVAQHQSEGVGVSRDDDAIPSEDLIRSCYVETDEEIARARSLAVKFMGPVSAQDKELDDRLKSIPVSEYKIISPASPLEKVLIGFVESHPEMSLHCLVAVRKNGVSVSGATSSVFSPSSVSTGESRAKVNPWESPIGYAFITQRRYGKALRLTMLKLLIPMGGRLSSGPLKVPLNSESPQEIWPLTVVEALSFLRPPNHANYELYCGSLELTFECDYEITMVAKDFTRYMDVKKQCPPDSESSDEEVGDDVDESDTDDEARADVDALERDFLGSFYRDQHRDTNLMMQKFWRPVMKGAMRDRDLKKEALKGKKHSNYKSNGPEAVVKRRNRNLDGVEFMRSIRDLFEDLEEHDDVYSAGKNYVVRARGSEWTKTETSKGGKLHKPWHPDEGVWADRVKIVRADTMHRALNLPESTSFDIHEVGGPSIGALLCCVWAKCGGIVVSDNTPGQKHFRIFSQLTSSERYDELLIVTSDHYVCANPGAEVEAAAGKDEPLTPDQLIHRNSENYQAILKYWSDVRTNGPNSGASSFSAGSKKPPRN